MMGRPDRTDFANYVAALPRPVGLLGLTHVTTGYLLREILDAGRIAAVGDCPVLHQPLVYAFYGRSAFRNSRDGNPSDLAYQFPAVLVLDPAQTPAPTYAFGFDSGAFVNNFMDDYLDPHMPLFDFHVPPDVASAAALAQHFFGGPKPFLRNQPAPAQELPASNFELASYNRMLHAGGRSSGSNRLDDRVSTPELIFADPIPLAGAVRGAVLPDVLAGDDLIGGRLEAAGVAVREYAWSTASRPSEYHMLIRSLVEGLYAEFGWGADD